MLVDQSWRASTEPVIDGVVMRSPITHVDHRGALFEIYRRGIADLRD